jgi:hypothetical protein
MKVLSFMLFCSFAFAMAVPIDTINEMETLAPAQASEAIENFDMDDVENAFLPDQEDEKLNAEEDLRKRHLKAAVKKIQKEVKRPFKKNSPKPAPIPRLPPTKKDENLKVKNDVVKVATKQLTVPVAVKAKIAVLPQNKENRVKRLQDFIAMLKNDVEKNHRDFLALYNVEINKLRTLLNKVNARERDFKKVSKQKTDIEARFIDMRKALELVKSEYINQNATVYKPNVDLSKYQDEQRLLTHLEEYVKVYQSLDNKDLFYHKHCICNHTVF